MIWFKANIIESFVCTMCHQTITRTGPVFFEHGWDIKEITKMPDPWYFVNRLLKTEAGLDDVMYLIGESPVCSPCMHKHAESVREIIQKV